MTSHLLAALIAALSPSLAERASPPTTPAIDAVAAAPAYVVVRVPTAVLVTAYAPDRRVIPAGMELQRVDETGAVIRTLGVLHDDGRLGDVKAGDRTFSLRIRVSEPAVGEVHLRVSAAVTGRPKRILSAVAVLYVDPFPLPPDPGIEGTLTLEGIDADRDGVRDDVQRFIGRTYGHDAPVHSALHQVFQDQQQFLAAGPAAAEIALLQIVERRSSALNCLQAAAGGPEAALATLRATKAILLNTRERSVAFVTADARLSGRFARSIDPGRLADSCRPF
jgi:hypothetical protein